MIDFDSYIRSGEPDKAERARNWSIAIGLQQIDGLNTSEYLADVAKRNIEGVIPTDRIPELVAEYYRKLSTQESVEADVEEADRAAANINKLLAEPSFTYSVAGLASIHRRIFDGVFKHAGQFRDYDITKKEWILRGATVTYGMATELKATVEYDLDREKQFSYKGLSEHDIIAHLARFIADLWQIHPFGEGNTRTKAVFLIKYLRSKGYTLDNEPFKQHSWYFRNALVRANYSNIREGVNQEYVYLERFLSNILLGTDFPLKNRYMHLDYKSENSDEKNKTENTVSFDIVNDTVNDTVNDALISLLVENPRLSYDDLAMKLGLSRSTIARRVKVLVKAGNLTRIGSDKVGHWQINKISQKSE